MEKKTMLNAVLCIALFTSIISTAYFATRQPTVITIYQNNQTPNLNSNSVQTTSEVNSSVIVVPYSVKYIISVLGTHAYSEVCTAAEVHQLNLKFEMVSSTQTISIKVVNEGRRALSATYWAEGIPDTFKLDAYVSNKRNRDLDLHLWTENSVITWGSALNLLPNQDGELKIQLSLTNLGAEQGKYGFEFYLSVSEA